jgi:hypothetical protein
MKTLNARDEAALVEAIFYEALKKYSLRKRSEYLDNACRGCPKLRQNIESLLKSHDSAGNFMSLPDTKSL